MNTVINGDTTVAEMIPIGLKEPNSFSEIGAVTVCAPVATDNEEDTAFGVNFE